VRQHTYISCEELKPLAYKRSNAQTPPPDTVKSFHERDIQAGAINEMDECDSREYCTCGIYLTFDIYR
jgi:hypothetical protein